MCLLPSPPTRGAWIEINTWQTTSGVKKVAPHPGGVD